MEIKNLHIQYQYFNSKSDLSDDDQILLQAAFDAKKGSHSPYSKFKVGAAVLLENGQIIKGSNQENASYPIGLCAERTALAAVVALFPQDKILTIAITASTELSVVDQPVAPCGICRQTILESEFKQHQNIRLILSGESGAVFIFNTVKDLLPLFFDSEHL
ncbi:MAG: cytidine deaminase [Bacteroidetes bacterium]|nr:cytidine deaminase [Bacteroidota bacterium]MBK8674247.1 cytidine deaminase [Bacteroidota bacterium]MBL0077887.1 cytidine deaminase [Bacteroidota bacterium]